MRRTTGLGLLLAATLVATSTARGEPTQATPTGARIRLEPIRTTWCVGDNVSVRYVVENVGDQQFEVTATPPGFDDWWVLQVFDASGQQVVFPRSGNMAVSWPHVTQAVTVARPFVRVVSLGRYGVLDRPGRYRVRLFHSLRWKGPGGKDYSGLPRELPPDEDPRWTETSIELLEPTPERVEAVLHVLEGHLDKSARHGSGDGVVPDPKLFRHAAFLEPLLARLRKDPRPRRPPEIWVEGIASIPTTVATSALLELLATSPASHAMWTQVIPRELCAAAVALRAPPVEVRGRSVGPGAGPPSLGLQLPHDLRPHAWSDELAPRARAWAREQLTLRGGSMDRYALRLLAAVGQSEDVAVIEALLGRSLDEARRDAAWPAAPDARDRVHDLIRVFSRVQQCGAAPSPDPRSAVEIVAALVWMFDRPEEAVARYGDRIVAWLGHENPIVRALALAALPRPVPEMAKAGLEAALDDGSPAVRYAALRALEHESDERFRPGVLRAFGRSDDHGDIWAAKVAAKAVGVDRVDLLLVDAARLAEPTAYPVRWQRLAEAAKYRGAWPQGAPSAEERERLAAVWTAFLERNRDALRQRGPFTATAEELAALAPR